MSRISHIEIAAYAILSILEGMKQKLYLWTFAALASLTLLYVHVQIVPGAPSFMNYFSPAQLTAAVTSAFAGEFDPTTYTREGLRNEGFFINDVRVGRGAEATALAHVLVHYTLATTDGRMLLDTRASKAPYGFTIGAGNVLKGFSIGVLGMREGGIRTLVIPPAYAYGDTPVAHVPAGEALVFTVELLSVE